MSTTLIVDTSSNLKVLTRRDSKDSCYSEDMDLSSTSSHPEDNCPRGVSPLAMAANTSPVSRKSSVSGDSGVSMECFGDLRVRERGRGEREKGRKSLGKERYGRCGLLVCAVVLTSFFASCVVQD